MGIISLEHRSNLYWLGRYAERVYTTMDSFFDYYDLMLDGDKNSYKEFLEKLSIADKYGDCQSFIQGYLYGADDFSINSTLRRAHDNALVIKSMIGSDSLAYIDLAANVFHSNRDAKTLRLALMPVADYLLAFWGCIDDKLANVEARNIIKCGKLVERLDLYFRLSRDHALINSEYEKLCHIIVRMRKGICNTQQLPVLVEVLAIENSYKERLDEVLYCLNKLFEELAY